MRERPRSSLMSERSADAGEVEIVLRREDRREGDLDFLRHREATDHAAVDHVDPARGELHLAVRRDLNGVRYRSDLVDAAHGLGRPEPDDGAALDAERSLGA